jgi:hypothetical protein
MTFGNLYKKSSLLLLLLLLSSSSSLLLLLSSSSRHHPNIMITIIVIIIDYTLYGIKNEDARFIMSVLNKCFPFFKQHFTESWKPYTCLSSTHKFYGDRIQKAPWIFIMRNKTKNCIYKNVNLLY